VSKIDRTEQLGSRTEDLTTPGEDKQNPWRGSYNGEYMVSCMLEDVTVGPKVEPAMA